MKGMSPFSFPIISSQRLQQAHGSSTVVRWSVWCPSAASAAWPATSQDLVRRLSWVSYTWSCPGWNPAGGKTPSTTKGAFLWKNKCAYILGMHLKMSQTSVPVFKAQLKDLKLWTCHLPSGSSLRCAPRYVPWHLPGHSGPSLQLVINSISKHCVSTALQMIWCQSSNSQCALDKTWTVLVKDGLSLLDVSVFAGKLPSVEFSCLVANAHKPGVCLLSHCITYQLQVKTYHIMSRYVRNYVCKYVCMHACTYLFRILPFVT